MTEQEYGRACRRFLLFGIEDLRNISEDMRDDYYVKSYTEKFHTKLFHFSAAD